VKHRPPPVTGPVAVSAALRIADTTAERRRLIVITATAGWGKTTAMVGRWPSAAWLNVDRGDRDPVSLARELVAAAGGRVEPDDGDDLPELVAEAWADAGVGTVVVDEGHHLRGSSAVALLTALSQHPDVGAQLVVASRRPLGLVSERRRGRGDVTELDATHLALDLDAADQLVTETLAPDRPLAARIIALTGGWPVGVGRTIEQLREVAATERPAAVERAVGADTPVGRYLDTVVLPETEPAERPLLVGLALAPELPAERLATLVDDVDDDGPSSTRDPAPEERLRGLVQAGLARLEPETDHVELTPAMREVVRERLPPRLDPAGELVERIVDRLLREDMVVPGLQLLTATGRSERAARLLEEQGRRLLRSGELSVVSETIATLPEEHRSASLEALRAEALAYRGDWAAAERGLAVAGVAPDGPLPTQLALGLGLIHHVRGDLDAALAAYDRGPERDDEDPDHAGLSAWRATAHWLRGEQEDARACAEISMHTATHTGDDRALAFAHTAAALVAASDGDRRANVAHYELALAAALRAGDELQRARIHNNRGSSHLEEGRYAEALAEIEVAIDLAERYGFASIMGVARCNRAQILLRTGAVDEAIADAERAREVFASIGSRTAAYADQLLGQARADRGELVLARQAYERALRLAEPAGDRQALVPAYVGIARAAASTDVQVAEEAADRAVDFDDGMARAEAHLAAAWVAVAGDRPVRAREHAQAALDEGQRSGNEPAIAEATTCLAVLADDLRGLEEALPLWRELEEPLWRTRVELGIARRTNEPAARSHIEELEGRLTALGCPADRGSVEHQLVVGGDCRPDITVRALGGFVIERGGRPVPTSEWGSRKARELVKILAARSGRRVTREEVAHLLWPDEPYISVTNRLSVALSIARSVLDGERAEGAPTPIASDGGTIRLVPEAVEVDVDTFRDAAERALRLVRSEGIDAAVPLLLQAEERYGGDLLEDEPDAIWAVDLRAELRALYLSVARAAARAVAREDPDLAIRLLLRVLDRDGYDESAHLDLCLALLNAGRHGEARRRHHLYEDRMRELEVPAVPFHELRRESRDAPSTADTGR
jgi:ATP/maltotriose-dependent transcriptional regulator MalT/DNA-binding SARP family transcriptional activator